MDLFLYSHEKQNKQNPSIYFDTMEKCKHWVKAINWILDPSPVGYRASMKSSMKKPGQTQSAKKFVSIEPIAHHEE